MILEHWKFISVCLLAWCLLGHWLFCRYLQSDLQARNWMERLMFILSGPLTWARFYFLWRR